MKYGTVQAREGFVFFFLRSMWGLFLYDFPLFNDMAQMVEGLVRPLVRTNSMFNAQEHTGAVFPGFVFISSKILAFGRFPNAPIIVSNSVQIRSTNSLQFYHTL